jgi:hypothetical protein
MNKCTILSWVMDEFNFWSKLCFLLSHICDEIWSWMIVTWIKNHLASDNACNTLRAALHFEAGPIYCVRGFKSSPVIGQKAETGPNPFTPRGQAELVI